MIDKQFIFITDNNEVKINPFGKKGNLCDVCDNKGTTCGYCHSFDMFWKTDQTTTNKLIKGMKKNEI